MYFLAMLVALRLQVGNSRGHDRPVFQQYIATGVRGNVAAAQQESPERHLNAGDDTQRCWGIRLSVGIADNHQVELRPVPLMTAEMCQNQTDLKVWRACQLAEIRDHVPNSYQPFAVEQVRKQFDDRRSELDSTGAHSVAHNSAKSQLPVLFNVAAMCETENELRAWRAHQIALVRNVHVSPRDQRFAEESVEHLFAQRLSYIQALPKTNSSSIARPVSTGEVVLERVGMADAGLEDGHRCSTGTLILLVFIGLLLPALISLAGGTCSRGSDRRERSATGGESTDEQSFGLQPMRKSLHHEDGDAYFLQA